MDTLKELYVEQLQDLHSANKQAKEVIQKMCDAATNSSLCNVLEKSVKKCDERNKNLEKIIKNYDESPTAEHCKGMEGLVKEARKHALEEKFGDKAVQDAQIIAQYQRISHYGVAGYGTCRAFAKQLGCKDEATTLLKDLEEICDGDEVLTSIAEGGVNEKAAA